MTSPESGSTRPLRVAGVALLGVAAVALIIGLVTVFGGSGDGRADRGEERPPEPTGTTTSRTSQPGNPPSSASTSKSVPPTTTTTTTTPKPTTTPNPTRPPGDGNGEPEKTVPVRVLNNSTIKGLAATAADDLRADGWQVSEVGNYAASNLPETTVFFRPGTDEEAAARALAATFGLPVQPRIDTLAGQPPGIIVVVTSDYVEAEGDKNEG